MALLAFGVATIFFVFGLVFLGSWDLSLSYLLVGFYYLSTRGKTEMVCPNCGQSVPKPTNSSINRTK